MIGEKSNKHSDHVVSKERVTDHGEVFTREREVEAMLDLVKNETDRIESRFLEPACGTGNFLAEVLARKLKVVEKRYGKSQIEFERYAVLSASSIYGIDLLEDNVRKCRERLFNVFEQIYSALFRDNRHEQCVSTVRYLFRKNIIWGDALTLMTADSNPQPITFSEWSPVNGSNLKRRDFTFHALLVHGETKELPLFSDLGDDVFIPEPVKECPVTHFLRIQDVE